MVQQGSRMLLVARQIGYALVWLANHRLRSAFGRRPSLMDQVRKQTRRRRMAICGICAQRHWLWCGLPLVAREGISCGCFVALKSAVLQQDCPQGLWSNSSAPLPRWA